MPLRLPIEHFAEAIAVWIGCVLLFVLVVLLRKAWIRRAKTQRINSRGAE